MAATYDILPIDVTAIFRTLTETMADNLSFDVSYYAETWQEVCSRMAKEGSPTMFVALIENFDETVSTDDRFIRAKFTLVIARRSELTWDSDKRKSTNFVPYLFPMYSELMTVVSKAHTYFQPYFRGYPPHTYVKSYNVGETQKTGLKLPESYDAIIISDLDLRINPQLEAKYHYGPLVRLMYLNNIADVVLAVSSFRLSIELNQHEYQSVEDHGEVRYYYYTSHDDETRSFSGLGEQIDMNLNGVAAGTYYGYLKAEDDYSNSILCFYYCLDEAGTIYKYSTSNVFAVNEVTTSGYSAPQYPVSMSVSAQGNIDSLLSVTVQQDYLDWISTRESETAVDTFALETISVPNTSVGSLNSLIQKLVVTKPGNDSLTLESFSYYELAII